MAIMVKTHIRGTDTKQQIRHAAHHLNRKLKKFLVISVVLNLVQAAVYFIKV